MGHAPVFVVEIERNNVTKLGLPTHRTFLDTLIKHGVSFDEFAQIVDEIYRSYDIPNDDDSEYIDDMSDNYDVEKESLRDIIASYKAFRDEFRNKYGLFIDCAYHDASEEGDCYDDIDGGYYRLDFSEIYQLSDKAKTLQKDAPFQISQFVVFG